MALKKTLVVIGFIILTVLHFDFWWFDQIHPILFGFMPIALWFQVLVGGVLASVFLYFAYKVIWPDIPENFEE
ncbi:hypothetical protein SAMN05192534_11763 [Alteribacillus persepolensis]|uniref:Solute:sodium symporter small subunit n=1 Tax=Alteribacillus persepolensis TaxID=568899 RepID=A0A1G8GY13_9BACI|nr:hypothetical protein [Alteribacillus persepolensis]SDH99244.1 hypothetical protein SAMN05192534_11763 [Alteribacillus persepolensis]